MPFGVSKWANNPEYCGLFGGGGGGRLWKKEAISEGFYAQSNSNSLRCCSLSVDLQAFSSRSRRHFPGLQQDRRSAGLVCLPQRQSQDRSRCCRVPACDTRGCTDCQPRPHRYSAVNSGLSPSVIFIIQGEWITFLFLKWGSLKGGWFSLRVELADAQDRRSWHSLDVVHPKIWPLITNKLIYKLAGL